MSTPRHQKYLTANRCEAAQKPSKPSNTQVGGTHYVDMPVQPWDAMQAILTHGEFIGFLKGNILKYSMRAGRKQGSDDAAKAHHYMAKLAEVDVKTKEQL